MKRLLRQPLPYLVLLILGSSVGCSSVLNRGDNGSAPEQISSIPSSPAPQSPLPSPKLNELDYVAQIVERVGPAVVRINSSRTVSQPGDSLFDQFFGDQGSSQRQIQRGTGSGFITTPDGRILTNAHVVEGADNVTVVLKDGRQFKGTVVGSDPTTDLAVVKISANNLPTLRLGNSDNLLPGQAAIAIGNPLGLSNTVTSGIISATGRSAADIGVSAERVNFIQTDAPINPGNSGGPLINSSGEVIGINSAIIQGAQGIGFAIPINTAQRIAQQIVTKGKAEHLYLGIQMVDLTPEIRSQINQSNSGIQVSQDKGVIIAGVQRNSPAARAGFRPGDIIESISGTAIQTSSQVQNQLEATNLGSTLEIIINRGGQSQTLRVKPELLPARQPT